jgi:hypothetical protein
MPGATCIRAATDGGPLQGGAPRVVWQTVGADPRVVSATSAAQRLDELGRACHLVWNPFQGPVVQMIPILRAGRVLGTPEGLFQAPPTWPDAGASTVPGQPTVADAAAGGPGPGGTPAAEMAGRVAEANAEGRLCVQICVVAFAWQPFTSWPMTGLPQILDWLDGWGIPRRWPAGPPAPFPEGLSTPAIARLWARGGHFGASQVPDVPAAGPGAINVERMTGPAGGREGRGGRGPASPEEMPDLDGYFGGGKSRTGALSRVG